MQAGILIKHATIANAVQFQAGGYISITKEIYSTSKVRLTFASPIEKIALIPKYLSDDNHLAITIDRQSMLHIGGMVKGTQKTYGIVEVSGKLIAMNTLEVQSEGSRFTVKLNGEKVFRFQSSLFAKGTVGILGSTGEVFYTCEIEEPQSTAWTTNVSAPGVEIKTVNIDGHAFMKLRGTATNKAEIKEAIALAIGSHTVSFSAIGTGKCLLKKADGTIIQTILINSPSMNEQAQVFAVAIAGNITLSFESNTELTVGKYQVEKRTDATTYIPNTNTNGPMVRKGSTLAFPLKGLFNAQTGSLYLKVSTKNEVPAEQLLVWSEDRSLQLKTGLDSVVFTMGTNQLAFPITLEGESSYEILVSWNANSVNLAINGENATAVNQGNKGVVVDRLVFASETSLIEEVVLEEWALFDNKIPFDEHISEHLPFCLMQALFQGGISGQNVTWSEIPVAPFDHSPILVQKDDGSTMKKVSFFDFETGEYRPWNEESFIFDGKSDYAEVSYNDLDEEFRGIAIRTEEGEKIGEPYRIDGKRIYFSLFSSQKELLKNKRLYATYQVNDTYTIDYNINAVDGYRIDFAKHDGQDRIVYQEGNRYGESKKLATMIDMNPIHNQNHEGFLYVTETINKTDSFRITATPDRLHADGGSFATLVIEPLDYQGNFLTHADLEITASKGFIARHIYKDAAEAQKRSGQYLYQYFAPYVHGDIDGEVTEDTIWVTDKENNIGVSYKMLLSPVKKAGAYRITPEEKELLTKKSTLIDYVLMYEGVEVYEDEELVSILDLNQDGRISMDDITVLETKERDNEITTILKRLREWEAK